MGQPVSLCSPIQIPGKLRHRGRSGSRSLPEPALGFVPSRGEGSSTDTATRDSHTSCSELGALGSAAEELPTQPSPAPKPRTRR